eukprot:156612-Pyramimonas_sp.AAC.1
MLSLTGASRPSDAVPGGHRAVVVLPDQRGGEPAHRLRGLGRDLGDGSEGDPRAVPDPRGAQRAAGRPPPGAHLLHPQWGPCGPRCDQHARTQPSAHGLPAGEERAYTVLTNMITWVTRIERAPLLFVYSLCILEAAQGRHQVLGDALKHAPPAVAHDDAAPLRMRVART